MATDTFTPDLQRIHVQLFRVKNPGEALSDQGSPEGSPALPRRQEVRCARIRLRPPEAGCANHSGCCTPEPPQSLQAPPPLGPVHSSLRGNAFDYLGPHERPQALPSNIPGSYLANPWRESLDNLVSFLPSGVDLIHTTAHPFLIHSFSAGW